MGKKVELIKIIYRQISLLLKSKKIPYNGYELLSWGNGISNSESIPQYIWIYWEKNNNIDSFLVNVCIKRVKDLHPNYKITILNENNINNYVKIPTWHMDLKIAQKADYYRLYLLKEYGGIWMDASVFLSESMDWMVNLYNGEDIIGFFTDECTTDYNYPILENWFLCAPPNNKLIKKWFSEFSDCLNSPDPFHYYDFFLSEKNNKQKLSKPQYLLAYCSIMKIMKEDSNYKIKFIRSGSEGHFYTYLANWQGDLLAKYLLLDKEPVFHPKIIKLNSGGRNAIDKYIRLNFFNRKSLIGRFL